MDGAKNTKYVNYVIMCAISFPSIEFNVVIKLSSVLYFVLPEDGQAARIML